MRSLHAPSCSVWLMGKYDSTRASQSHGKILVGFLLEILAKADSPSWRDQTGKMSA